MEVDDTSTRYNYGIKVTNTGKKTGDECVLAFMHPPTTPTSGGLPLIKQLFGFERVSLAPSDSTTVYFDGENQ